LANTTNRHAPDAKPLNERPGVTLCHLLGIEIRLDPSVLIIFTLVVVSLGFALFPRWHPEWPAWLTWATALTAGLAFFASLLAHELAHSVVARARGIPVPRITLFLFGGASEMSSEPRTAGGEFLIAIVGPLMSLALGLLFSWTAVHLAPPEFASQLETNPEAALASLSPAATLVLWLGPVNLLLGIFNLIPGFPLDGGRVLRAAVWWLTGDFDRATRWAARGGQLIAWTIIALGVLEAASGRLQGLWLVLIGWFLNHAASATQQQAVLQRRLKGLRVGDLMRTHVEHVAAERSVRDFVEEELLRSAQQVWPVTAGDRTVGLVALADIADVPVEERARLRVREVMRPIANATVLTSDMPAREALEHLMDSSDAALPVMRGDQLQGLIDRSDIFRWLAAHGLRAS